jgi:hypothetical protein
VVNAYAAFFHQNLSLPSYSQERVAAPAAEPHAELFACIMGRLPSDGSLQYVSDAFQELKPTPFHYEASSALTVDEFHTPLSIGSLGVSATNADSDIELMLVDPTSPPDLVALWNARAFGNHVRPIPKPWDDYTLNSARHLIEKEYRDKW